MFSRNKKVVEFHQQVNIDSEKGEEKLLFLEKLFNILLAEDLLVWRRRTFLSEVRFYMIFFDPNDGVFKSFVIILGILYDFMLQIYEVLSSKNDIFLKEIISNLVKIKIKIIHCYLVMISQNITDNGN